MDLIDLSILEALQEDGRLALSELGRRIGLSQPATSERVKRLEDTGVIAGYTARINPFALGSGLMALVRLRVPNEKLKACVKHLQAMPEIIEMHRVTGDDCFILKIIVPTPADLAAIADEIGQFGPSSTAVVLRSEKMKPVGRQFFAKGLGRKLR